MDFILADHTAIEVKAKENVSLQDLKSLRALSEEKKWKRLVCVSLEKRPRTVDNIELLPYRDFLEMLWSDAFN